MTFLTESEAADMKTAGFNLEFPSVDVGVQAQAVCEKTVSQTGWKGKTGLHLNNVFVRTDTPLDKDDFNEDDFESGDTLFQRMCLALAEKPSFIPFSGRCYFEAPEEHRRLRISVSFTNNELWFNIRNDLPTRVQLWHLYWNRQPDGTYVQGQFHRFREKEKN